MKKNQWLQTGYYIVEPVTKPEFVALPCKQILSVSDCFCTHHPDLDEFYWLGTEEKSKKYQNKFRLADEIFFQMKEDVSVLFEKEKMGSDGMFYYLEDAKRIYQKYFCHNREVRIIGISVEDDFFQILQEEMGNAFQIPKLEKIQGKMLGYEIIGWDISRFHSYLCNGLEKVIIEEYSLIVNHQGLLQNSYEEIVDFVKRIKGMGEPVEWIPVALHDCSEFL